MSKCLLPALVILSLAVCLAQSPATNASPSATGIEGTITISPTHGGPVRDDVSSSGPLANIEFVVQKEQNTVASFTTDAEGHFRISVPPGHYTVALKERRGHVGRYGPFEVEVTADQMTKVQWNCDSGMR